MLHVEKACELIKNDYTHVLEFGVYMGRTLSAIRKKLENPKYKIYGFDSFEGLPEDWVQFDGGIAGEGACVKSLFTTSGATPDIQGVSFYVGLFEDTLKDYLKIADNIALLHVDCDLYSSTKTVMYTLNDYIKKDTIIVFDEWFYNGYQVYNDHEQKLFYEWVRDFNRKYELLNYCPQGYLCEQQIVKIIE